MADPRLELQKYFEAQARTGIPAAGKSPEALYQLQKLLRKMGGKSDSLKLLGSRMAGLSEWIPSLSEMLKPSSTPVELREIQKLLSEWGDKPKGSRFQGELLKLENLKDDITRTITAWGPHGARDTPPGTFESVRFPRQPFIDIDLPSKSHLGASVTAGSTEEAIEKLIKYQKAAAKKGLTPGGPVYMTPAGIHYLEEGFEMNPRKFNRLSKKGGSDPFYRAISRQAKPLRVGTEKGSRTLGRIPPGFSIRVGPKSDVAGNIRTEMQAGKPVKDYIKMLIGRLGEGGSATGEQARLIHDDLIKKNLATMSQGPLVEGRGVAGEVAESLSPEIKKALKMNPQSLARMVRQGVPLIALSLLLGGVGLAGSDG